MEPNNSTKLLDSNPSDTASRSFIKSILHKALKWIDNCIENEKELDKAILSIRASLKAIAYITIALLYRLKNLFFILLSIIIGILIVHFIFKNLPYYPFFRDLLKDKYRTAIAVSAIISIIFYIFEWLIGKYKSKTTVITFIQNIVMPIFFVVGFSFIAYAFLSNPEKDNFIKLKYSASKDDNYVELPENLSNPGNDKIYLPVYIKRSLIGGESTLYIYQKIGNGENKNITKEVVSISHKMSKNIWDAVSCNDNITPESEFKNNPCKIVYNREGQSQFIIPFPIKELINYPIATLSISADATENPKDILNSIDIKFIKSTLNYEI